MPSTGELYNWTWLTPLAQNASVGRPKKPGFWNSWMRQMPLAEAIVGIWFQQPCEPPKGAAGLPHADIGVIGPNTTTAGTGITCPDGDTST